MEEGVLKMTRICTTNQPSQALSRLFLGEAAMVSLKVYRMSNPEIAFDVFRR